MPYLGELKLMSTGRVPNGWARCDGQLLQITLNQQLFALLGTTYGGDGQTTFALPDLRGRTPRHIGSGNVQGQRLGAESRTINTGQLPAHAHAFLASSALGDQAVPTGRLLAGSLNQYRAPSDLTALHPASVLPVGGGQAHDNKHPFLVLSWLIAIQGIFPSRN
jgi:microcystin-dependent protein